MSQLAPGTILKSKRGHVTTVVGEPLGDGGQGAVYKVTSDSGESLALKLYRPPQPGDDYDEQRKALEDLIEMRPPDERFLWPIDLVHNAERFGYLMPLVPREYLSMETLIRGHGVFPKAGPYRSLFTAAMGLVDCFRRLHLRGLCYKDINNGAPFIRCDTGEVRICDNDNVRHNNSKGRLYVPEFAAPEVVRGIAPCTTVTDQHSLAVLLFYLLVRGNPLDGKREAKIVVFDEPAKLRTYGTSPIFVYDPVDESNRPLRGLHTAVLNNWPRIPRFVQEAFTTTFTAGLNEPGRRLNDTEWLRVLSRARDTLFRCQHCQLDTIRDLDVVQRKAEPVCCLCGRTNRVPPRLRIGDKEMSVSEGCQLFAHHFGGSRDLVAPIAEFMRHESKAEIVGLRNLTHSPWSFTDNGGPTREVPSGKSVAFAEGRQVNFALGVGVFVQKGS